MSTKRSLASARSYKHHTRKLKGTITASSSGSEDPELVEPDLKDFNNVPVIKQEDNARLLPKYTSILSKNGEEAVGMDDLDLLQHDLEKLLSTNALRTRFFLGEYTQAEKDDKKTSDNTTVKKKIPKLKHGIRVLKTDPFRSNERTYKEIPKIKLPRNNNFDKFWATVDPYCAPIGKDNLAFLDSFIQESAQDVDTKINDIGECYTKLWIDELVDDEEMVCKLANNQLQDNIKGGMASFLESYGCKSTKTLLAETIHDKVLDVVEAEVEAEAEAKVKAEANDKAEAENASPTKIGETEEPDGKADEINSTKASIRARRSSDQSCPEISAPLAKRLMKAFVEEGILTKEDVMKGPEEDDIMTEVEKCKADLLIVNDHNIVELNKLRAAVVNDIQCTELRDELNKVDKQVLDLYNSYAVAKLRDEGKDKEKSITEPMKPEFSSKASALLRQRYELKRKINDIEDMSYYY